MLRKQNILISDYLTMLRKQNILLILISDYLDHVEKTEYPNIWLFNHVETGLLSLELYVKYQSFLAYLLSCV
jgi:hypothetical protein